MDPILTSQSEMMNNLSINIVNSSSSIKSALDNVTLTLNNLGRDLSRTVHSVNLSLHNLSSNIDESSRASDRHANKMYWLTLVLAGTGIINLVVVIVQIYLSVNNK